MPKVKKCDKVYDCPFGDDEIGCEEGNLHAAFSIELTSAGFTIRLTRLQPTAPAV